MTVEKNLPELVQQARQQCKQPSGQALVDKDAVDACLRVMLPEARVQLMGVLVQADEFDFLRWVIDSFDPGIVPPMVHYYAGVLARKNSTREKALECFQQALVMVPTHVGFPLEVASELLFLNRVEEGQKLVRRYLETYPESVQARILMGQFARKENQKEQAAAWFGQAVQLDQKHQSALRELISELIDLGKFDEARKYIQQLIALPGCEVAGRIVLATLARREGRRNEALEEFLAATLARPGDPGLVLEVAAERMALGQHADALKDLQGCVVLQPANRRCLIMLGQVCRLLGRLRESADWLEKAHEQEPDNPLVLLEYGTLLFMLGDFESARSVCANLLEQDPNSAQGWLLQAQIEHKFGQMEAAICAAEKALAQAKDKARSLLFLASLRRESGQFEEAQSILDMLPVANHADALVQKALLARAAGDRAKSLDIWIQLNEVNPADRRVRVEIGSELLALGRSSEVARWLGEPVEPISSAAECFIRGQVAFHEENEEGALEWWKKGVELQPEHQSCYAGLVDFYIRKNDFCSVNLWLSRGLENAQDKNNLELQNVGSLRLQGALEEALAAGRKKWEECRTLDAFRVFVEVLLQIGDVNAAAEALTQFSAPRSSHEESVLGILKARVLFAQYKFSETAKQLKLVHEIGLRQGYDGNLLFAIVLGLNDYFDIRKMLSEFDQSFLRSSSAFIRAAHHQYLAHHVFSEMQLNPLALKRVLEAHSLVPEQRVSALCDLLKDEPWFIAAAMMLLVLLREKGAFSEPRPRSGVKSTVIPRKIVQYWDDPEIPEGILELMMACPKKCKGFEHQIYNADSAYRFLREKCSRRVVAAFFKANHPALQADIFRLAYLAVCGGIYIDADDLIRDNFIKWLDDGFDLILHQEVVGSIGNNFMAAAPGHPFILRCLEHVVDDVLEERGENVWLLTGPGAISSMFCAHWMDELAQGLSPEGVLLIDAYKIQGKISMHLPKMYKRSARSWFFAAKENMPLFKKTVSFRR